MIVPIKFDYSFISSFISQGGDNCEEKSNWDWIALDHDGEVWIFDNKPIYYVKDGWDIKGGPGDGELVYCTEISLSVSISKNSLRKLYAQEDR